MYKLFQYNDNQFRIVCTKDNNNLVYNDNDNNITDDDEIQRISLSRSRRMIREYALCNDFMWFFTCTVDSQKCDRFSLSDTQKNIRKIMKSIKRKQFNFKYLFITEKHKNGAFHFHGLCTELPLYVNDNGYWSSADFDKLGFNSFSSIKNKTKCANYITKYITKDCVKNEQGSVYFCSRGLKRATSYQIQPISLDRFKTFSNDYCKILDFDTSCLDSDDLLYLSYNIKELV